MDARQKHSGMTRSFAITSFLLSVDPFRNDLIPVSDKKLKADLCLKQPFAQRGFIPLADGKVVRSWIKQIFTCKGSGHPL